MAFAIRILMVFFRFEGEFVGLGVTATDSVHIEEGIQYRLVHEQKMRLIITPTNSEFISRFSFGDCFVLFDTTPMI